LDGQLRSKLRAIVACPHCVPFIAGGNGKCFPSNLFNGVEVKLVRKFAGTAE
jgi:hypothetical protein